MVHRSTLIVASALVIAGACAANARNVERNIELGPVRSHGVDGQLVVHGRRVSGELLEVSDTAFVLQSGDVVVLVPRVDIDESNFRGLETHRGAELTGEVVEQHRLLSRFPMGMPPAALRSLLRQSGQSELKVITQ